MEAEGNKVPAGSNSSQRIIALGIVFAFLYWASSVVMTLLLAVLLAYFLDPVVKVLEKVHIPRALGALFVLLAVTSIFGGLGYLLVDRADQFLADWPLYSAAMRTAATLIDRKLAIFEKRVAPISPAEEKGPPPVGLAEPRPVSGILFIRVASSHPVL